MRSGNSQSLLEHLCPIIHPNHCPRRTETRLAKYTGARTRGSKFHASGQTENHEFDFRMYAM